MMLLNLAGGNWQVVLYPTHPMYAYNYKITPSYRIQVLLFIHSADGNWQMALYPRHPMYMFLSFFRTLTPTHTLYLPLDLDQVILIDLVTFVELVILV